jgi:hypothetical protein
MTSPSLHSFESSLAFTDRGSGSGVDVFTAVSSALDLQPLAMNMLLKTAMPRIRHARSCSRILVQVIGAAHWT